MVSRRIKCNLRLRLHTEIVRRTDYEFNKKRSAVRLPLLKHAHSRILATAQHSPIASMNVHEVCEKSRIDVALEAIKHMK